MKTASISLIVIFYLILNPSNLYSQNNNTESALYNIGLSSIGSAIGAVINKNPKEKTGKVFVKGLWQGSIGGVLVFGSKKINNEIYIQKKLELNWPAKIVNAAGISIIENAASNRNFWERWNLNIGFNRFEFHTKNGFNFKYKIKPIALVLTIAESIDSKPEWDLMLKTGEVIFSTAPENLPNLKGRTTGPFIKLRDDSKDSFAVITHEIIHVYQGYDYSFVSTYFNKTRANLSEQSKTFSKLDNIFHWDLHAAVLGGLYQIENINIDCSSDNFFENEAQFYSFQPRNCNEF